MDKAACNHKCKYQAGELVTETGLLKRSDKLGNTSINKTMHCNSVLQPTCPVELAQPCPTLAHTTSAQSLKQTAFSWVQE